MERILKEKIAGISSKASPELAPLIKEEICRAEEENGVLTGVVYTLSEQDALRALKKIKRGRFKRVFQAALAASLALCFLISYLRDRSYIQGLILGLVCIALLAVFVIIPRQLQKQEARSQSGRERFLLAGDKTIFSSDGESCFQLHYKNDMVRIQEDEEFYYIHASHDRNWCIPKEALSREELSELEEVFGGVKSFF